jgi:general transcription factor 3C polypeptide 5 (transcription factor C subunit 1)
MCLILWLESLQFLDPDRQSIPLFLSPDSPYRRPILSHNAVTHNVLLQVTVPKRTGRKRKRGTNGPFEGEIEMVSPDGPQPDSLVSSKSRLDDPKVIRRKLQDNVDRYRVRAVGVIKRTHRFRGTVILHCICQVAHLSLGLTS